MTRPTAGIELPPKNCSRWTPGRKEAVLRAIRRGIMTESQVATEWGLDRAEIDDWRRRSNRYGRRGLSVTKLQIVGREIVGEGAR